MYSSNLEQLANLQNLVPQGLSLSFDKVIPFDPNIPALAAKLVDDSSNGIFFSFEISNVTLEIFLVYLYW